jgi:hypothetical protein
MKNLIRGSIAILALIAGPAIAADMPVKAKAPPPVAVYDWSGAMSASASAVSGRKSTGTIRTSA